MRAYRTAEVRWFMPGAIPPAVRDWFDALGPGSSPGQAPEAETRTDLYLAPTSDALGVKLRDGRVEAKRRTGTLGLLDLEGGPVEVEAWAKWSFETPTALESRQASEANEAGWIPVEKTRRQRHADGCALELSRIVLEGEDWWSVCLEATGADDAERRSALEAGARRWLAIEDAPSLASSDAAGYPAWLRARRP
ncbi:hypothetical protein [Rubrivirga sp.]|uniref:hypothetical protein n=1 Tax=Rubrivirga sp. TaxID=1885344 RepID=UPI003C75C3E5